MIKYHYLIIFQLILCKYIICQSLINKTDSIPSFYMNEIVLLGNRSSSPHRLIIEEIPKSKINMLDVTDVSDALVFSSGLYFSKNSKNQTNFKLHDFEQRQITVGMKFFVE